MGGQIARRFGPVPTAFRDLSGTMRLLIVAGFAVLAIITFQAVTAAPSEAGFWIRAELTLAALIGFIFGALSIRGSVGRVRPVRSWITLGLGLWLARALIRDVVLLVGPRREPRAHHPAIDRRPGLRRARLRGGPSRPKLGRSEELTVYLDGAIVFFATGRPGPDDLGGHGRREPDRRRLPCARHLLPRPVRRDAAARPDRAR